MYCKWNPVTLTCDFQQKHPFHLVEPSPLPFATAMSLAILVYQLSFYLHGCHGPIECLYLPIVMFLEILSIWFEEILSEADEGHHNERVVQGLKYGMLLFIVSEVMFFFSFFFSYFYYSLSPSI
jgi:hypothetical protein